jgi:hypothetical protein
MATILAPNKSHNGISAGVRFTAGVGHTDRPAPLAYFRKAGYTILPDGAALPEPEPVAKVPVEKVLHRMNGKAYSLGADGSIRSPFAPGEQIAEVHAGEVILPALKPVSAPQGSARKATRRSGRR